MFILSPYTRVISARENSSIAYHSLFGRPLILDEQALNLLKSFAEGRSQDFSEKEREIFQQFRDLCLVIDEGIDERALLRKKLEEYERHVSSGSLVTYLSLIMSECCNLRCNYCIAQAFRSQRNSPNQQELMRSEIAFRAVDAFARLIIQNRHPEAYLNFGGGEPLLNLKTIKMVIDYCVAAYPKANFRFSINTNAALISQRIANFLAKNNVQIATSLDGPREWNDKVRKTRTSQGAYEAIVSGFRNLKTAGAFLSGFSVTITSENLPGIDEQFLDWAAREGYVDVRLDPDVIHIYSISPEKLALRLVELKRYGQKLGIYVSGFWERPAENMYPSVLEKQTGFCGGQKGYSMCVAPSGDIYVCGYSGTKVGSVLNDKPLLSSRYAELITSRFVGNNKGCIGCAIEGQCIGGCYIAEELATTSDSDNSVLDFNCRLYRAATIELLKDQAAIS